MLLISDVHFGINQQSEVDRILRAADPSLSNGCVIIAGDLVQRATESEYAAAGDFVEELIALGNVVCMTPGNHDFQISGAPDGTGTDKVNFIPTAWDKARRLYREHVLAPLIAQDAVVAHGAGDEATRYDFIARHGDDVFVCLRSSHRRSFKVGVLGFRSIGRIRRAQIEWARLQLEEHAASDARIHLVSHRSLWKTEDDKHPPLSKRKRVEAFMKDHKIVTYIHGHNHKTRFSRTPTTKLGYPVIRLGLPSVCDRVDETERAFITWDPAIPEVAYSETVAGKVQVDFIDFEEAPPEPHESIANALDSEDWDQVLKQVAELEEALDGAPLEFDPALAKIHAIAALEGAEAAGAELETQLGNYDSKQIETYGFASSAEETIARATNG